MVAALAALTFCRAAAAEDVILHLRNGDRLAVVLLSESTNSLRVSNAWAGVLTVPVSQVERREMSAVAKAPPPPGLPAIPAPPLTTWNGNADLGTDVLRGAANRELYHTRLSLTYANPYERDPKQFFRNTFTYWADYGMTEGVRSANNMAGTSKTDFDLSRKVYAYNLGGGGYDEIRKIDLHVEEGPGAGWHMLAVSNFVFNAELGANYQAEDRADNTERRNFYYRLGQNLTWRPGKLLTLAQKMEYLPRVEDLEEYRFRFESTLSYALMLNLSLNLSVVNFYDTQPVPGVPPNDLQVRTSLGVKF